MNWDGGYRDSILLVADGPGVGHHWRRRLGTAVVADYTLLADWRLRLRPVIGAAGPMVTTTPFLRTVDRQLASRWQHRPQDEKSCDYCSARNTSDRLAGRCRTVDYRIAGFRRERSRSVYSDSPAAVGKLARPGVIHIAVSSFVL